VIHFKCYYCGQPIKVPDELETKKGKCPKCKHSLVIPKTELAETRAQKPSFNNMSNEDVAKLLLTDREKKEQTEEAGEIKPPSFLMPTFDETILFSMSIALLLLPCFNTEMREELLNLIDIELDAVTLIVGAFLVGACLSIYHAFSKREKTTLEKIALLLFAVTVTACTGIYAGYIMLKQASGWLLVFPVWNIIYGFILILLVQSSWLDEESISDRDATFPEVLMSLISVIIIILCCNYFFKLHWVISYSICIAYVTSLSKAVQNLFNLDEEDEQSY
jgi:hypothetical protein